MKIIIVLSLFAIALAGAQSSKEPIPIVRQDSIIDPDGSFKYLYETGNGIAAEATGAVRNIGAEEPALQIIGKFSYPSDDGPVSLSYVADENGYVAQGSVLPTSPPIPADIQRALDYLATAPPYTGN